MRSRAAQLKDTDWECRTIARTLLRKKMRERWLKGFQGIRAKSFSGLLVNSGGRRDRPQIAPDEIPARKLCCFRLPFVRQGSIVMEPVAVPGQDGGAAVEGAATAAERKPWHPPATDC